MTRKSEKFGSIAAGGILAVLLLVFCTAPALAQPPIGGDQGWFLVHCNVEGAQVFFDGTYMGDITSGQLYVPVYTTGTPYTTYTVSKEGYSTYTGDVGPSPGKGETFDLYATLNPIATTVPTLIGGDVGWFTVHCNVDGATVMLDNTVEGTINQGTLTIQVYVTGTPYRTFTVTKEGYQPYTGSITQYPGKGETVDLYATLNPTPTPTTKAPIGAGIAVIALAGAAVALLASRKHL
ncbi:hypothetical protein J2741_002376 [Methanolinea mesophila]|uniref:hypothetical protein n=1 Tax=Methanolinea mesophila TaxID=547055 RepID=UPI001AE88A4F|nr:hypothetical protein [Methanolinea mesophila]MBP1929780.1 hypothetical protein [Methanolinea mesophila]